MNEQATAERVLTPVPGYLRDAGAAAHIWRAVVRFIRRKPLGAFSAAVLLLLLVVGLAPKLFAPHAYDDFSILTRLTGPSSAHLFGTDDQGRDVLSRIVYGSQTSLIVGLGSVAFASTLATIVGLVSGYYGGWFDLIVQRLVDIWLAFPGLLYVVFVVAIFGHGRGTLILTIGLLFAAGSSRLIRGQTLATKVNQYVDAERMLGAGDLRIMVRHILPNIASIILINATIQMGAVMLIESTLSFLGYGVPPPFPSWGRMLREAQSQMQNHPYLALFPGLMIALTVYASNMLGDALRDVLDPRLRGVSQ